MKSFKLESMKFDDYDLESILLNLPIKLYPEIHITNEFVLFIYLAYHEKLSFGYIEHPVKKIHLHRYIDKINEIIHLTGIFVISNKKSLSNKVFTNYDIVYKKQIFKKFGNEEEIRKEDYCVLRNLSILLTVKPPLLVPT